VKAVLEELSQALPLDKTDLLEEERVKNPGMEKFLLQLKGIQKRYWKNLE
jgi:hypothetical protein